MKSSYGEISSKTMRGTNPLKSPDAVRQRSASWCFQPAKHIKHDLGSSAIIMSKQQKGTPVQYESKPRQLGLHTISGRFPWWSQGSALSHPQVLSPLPGYLQSSSSQLTWIAISCQPIREIPRSMIRTFVWSESVGFILPFRWLSSAGNVHFFG